MKKPSPPTLADYLRGNSEIINSKWEDVGAYRKKLFTAIAKEFGTDDPMELVFHLTEKYHEDHRQNEKQGRKGKWTPEIEAMLAVFIELRHEQANPRSVDADITWMLENTIWGEFAQKGNLQETNGHEAFKKHYQKGKKSTLFQVEMELVNEDMEAWKNRLIKLLKG